MVLWIRHLPSTTTALLAVGSLVLWFREFFPSDALTFFQFALFFTILWGGYALTSALRTWETTEIHRWLVHEAEYSVVADERATGFVLLLRSYEEARLWYPPRIERPNSFIGSVVVPSWMTAPRSLVAMLARAIYPHSRLIAIGGDKVGQGATLSVPDDQWRQLFENLAPRAAAIVIVPGMTAGLESELRWLVSRRLLTKCCAVVDRRDNNPALWDRTQEVFRRSGFAFPHDLNCVTAFRFSASGDVESILESVRWPASHVADHVADILAEQSSRWSTRRLWFRRRWHRIGPRAAILSMVTCLVLWLLLAV